MWDKIKKWLGFADLNRDGKLNAEDLALAQALAEQKIKDANEAINKVAVKVDVAADKVKKTAARVRAKTKKK